MYILGIETSCDETSCSVVKDGKRIISNVVSSSLKLHKEYGGVVPEIASRAQLEKIFAVCDCALKESGRNLKDIGLISVTSGPGLLGSLLVGISFAKSVCQAKNIPLLGVNHVYSHIYANFLHNKKLRLPFVALVVSGGHTSLFFVKDFDKIEVLGETLDDACGEAFDKVAKILRLSYPGGPIIERLAKKGNPKRIKFNCSGTKNPLDFSFSGIKTAVLYYLKKNSQLTTHNSQLTADIAASFQETVIDTLIQKSILACKLKKVTQLIVGGGVAANKRLREKFEEETKEKEISTFFPPRELCLDNAAMVAGLGYRLFKKGQRSDLYLTGSV
jgi:N6-L-threonylcarbamoyladenine synthase